MTTVSFVIEEDSENALRLYLTATFRRDEDEWNPVKVSFDKGMLYGNRNLTMSLTPVCTDWVAWLKGWLKDNPEPRVLWIQPLSGAPSVATTSLWSLLDQQAEEDEESAISEEQEKPYASHGRFRAATAFAPAVPHGGVANR